MIHDKYDDEGELVDRFSIHEPERTSAEGYRLIWYHSARKAELDAAARQQRIERAVGRPRPSCAAKLASPRTRHRERAKVAEAVEAILEETGTAAWIDGDDRGADRGDVTASSGAAGPAPTRCT